MSNFKYFILHKPFGVLSQFTREVPSHQVLADLYDFPSDVYPVGRLDRDSEGLLILTDDKRLNQQLLNPSQQHWREYWVQVEGIPDVAALNQLSQGVQIRINKKDYTTQPSQAQLMDEQPKVAERDPPIRFRKSVPDSWLSLQLKEGKNRQVRRMCAAVGYPVLRLVRVAIEDLQLFDWAPRIGQVVEIHQTKLFELLHIRKGG